MIIFDLDGTLWDTTQVTYISANNVAARHDEVNSFSMKTIKNGMGLSFDENTKQYMPYLNQEDSSKYLDEIIDENIKNIKQDGAILYDGVIDTIKYLSQKYKLGIITNNNDEYVEAFFKTSGLKSYFTDYMGAASYNITKGSAIKIMVTRNKTEDNYYVGDILNDKLSSQEAGVKFIHARYGFGHNFDSEYYIDKISDLLSLLNKIKR